jgi:chromosomal replication initiation ATPase DnaA
MNKPPHHPEHIQRLADICLMFFEGDVYNRCRERRFVDARITFSKLINEQGVLPTHIGRILGRNHATVLHYLKKGEALLETDKIFRRNFVKCREEYIGEDPIYYYSAPELRTKYLEMRDDYEDLSDRYHALHKRLKSDRRLEPLIDMVRMRTKRGTEDEVFHKLNRIYNGL